MNDWLVIDYASYWDVPREFVVESKDGTYFFESRFDDSLDDYSDSFLVYRITAAASDVQKASWSSLKELGPCIGEIPVNEVQFKSELIPNHPLRAHLRFVNSSVFDILQKRFPMT